uniref:golgin subfamily A member 6-like protein 22 n=1 Tax=Styela clava TaxID=7725 RepID=UPI00193A41AC|nr:golgin subfamily A member 6-like protein 22 [Styela clava]
MEKLSSTLITKKKNDKMRINHDALRNVLIRPEIGDRPVAIISVAGRMRTGKSFLLNFIIRYLRAEGWNDSSWIGSDDTTNCGFVWKQGKDQMTIGIEIWNEVFYVPQPNGGQELAVLLMDTQGLFDQSTPEDVNISLLTLSTLISSVQIYNGSSNLDTRNMAYLKTCVDFALATAQVNEPFFKLQTINFLVRDAEEESGVEESFGYESGGKYLRSILESQEGGKDNIRVRKGLKRSFSKVDCFLLPHPGLKAKKNGFKGKNEELEEDFKTYVKVFVEGVASPQCLHPKISKSRNNMTAREICNMMAACDKLFAQGMYKAENLVEANIRVHFSTECEEAFLQYKRAMEQSVDISKYVEESKIIEQHEVAKSIAMQRYKQTQNMGDGRLRLDYKAYLESKCETHLEELKIKNRINKEKWELKVDRNTEEAIRQFEFAMNEFTSSGVFETKRVINCHREQIEKIRKKRVYKINEEKLKVETDKRLDQIIAINKENKEIEERNKRDEESTKKYNLALRLSHQCAREWSKVLSECQTEQEMEDHAARIENLLWKKYWKQFLTNTERKYIDMLRTKVEEEFKKALDARGNQYVYMKPVSKPRQSRTDEPEPTFDNEVERMRKKQEQRESELPRSERPFYRLVNELIEGYAKKLQNNLDINTPSDMMKIIHDTARSNLESEYLSKMCSHVLDCWKQLKDIMAHKYKEALERNEENLKHGERKIQHLISEMIWEEEERLQEIMVDRCIHSEELTKHYKDIQERFLEIMMTAEVKLMFTSSGKHSIEALVNRRLEKSKEKMYQLNEAAKQRHHVETEFIEKKRKSWWKRVSKFFTAKKGEFEFSDPLE